METNNKLKSILKQVSKDLQQTSQTYQLDAELLISYVLKKSREYIYLNPDKIVLKTELQQLNKIVKQRKEGKPIAYIIKEKPFFNHNFFVDNRVLIPRPETELLVEKAINILQENENKYPNILDICCGSGCVGLSIFDFFSGNLTLSDISQDALNVAKINITNIFQNKDKISKIKLQKSDLFDEITGRFDLITANPPYLSQKDMIKFGENLKFEPKTALLGGKTGFEITEKIIKQAEKYLNKNGFLLVELGFEGFNFINEIKTKTNLIFKNYIKDYSGILRHAVWQKQ